MALKVIQDLGDDAVQSELMPRIAEWYEEVRVLLPSLPEHMQIFFFEQDSEKISTELGGIAGMAYSSDIISLGFLLIYDDKKEQLKQLKSVVFHEALHVAQGQTVMSGDVPLLESMVYEGLATVFEREIIGNDQPYGKYPSDDSKLKQWLKAISQILPPIDYENVYNKWAFYDETDNQRWKLYKAGTWFIDQILLENKDLSVIDLTKMSAKEILKLKS